MRVKETRRFSLMWILAFALLVPVALLLFNSISKSAGQARIPERSGRDIQDGVSPIPEPTAVPKAQNAEEIGYESEFSFKSLKKAYNEADVVVYAEVLTMNASNMDPGYRPYMFTARVKEAFKGDFRLDDTIEYVYTIEVFDNEPDYSTFLGERVLWLHRWKDKGTVRYGLIEFVPEEVKYNILEKLRKISGKQP
jgi:hypothetical protein